MDENDILTEYELCKQSPYYFATKYLTVKNANGKFVPFTTLLTEEEFNKTFEQLKQKNMRIFNTIRKKLNG